MLVISRRLGEKLRIGENITVKITAVRDNTVRIGIDAPDDIEILRDELYKRKENVPTDN
jgi:carbon storage regulator